MERAAFWNIYRNKMHYGTSIAAVGEHFTENFTCKNEKNKTLNKSIHFHWKWDAVHCAGQLHVILHRWLSLAVGSVTGEGRVTGSRGESALGFCDVTDGSLTMWESRPLSAPPKVFTLWLLLKQQGNEKLFQPYSSSCPLPPAPWPFRG